MGVTTNCDHQDCEDVSCCASHRRNILWSAANPVNSILWTCNEISPLWEVGCVHCVVCSGVQVVTNVHWWRSDMNSLIKSGRGAPESQRVVREDENEVANGGLRNAARALDQVPGWKMVG